MTDQNRTATGGVVASFEAFSRFLGFLAGLVVIGVSIVILYDVVVRYFFNKPTSWAMDIAEIAMVPIVYLALAYTTQVGGHVKMDLLVTRFSLKNQLVLSVVSNALSLIFASAAIYSGVDLALNFVRRWPTTTASSIPQAPVALLIPIAAVLFFIQLIVLVVKDIQSIRRGELHVHTSSH